MEFKDKPLKENYFAIEMKLVGRKMQVSLEGGICKINDLRETDKNRKILILNHDLITVCKEGLAGGGYFDSKRPEFEYDEFCDMFIEIAAKAEGVRKRAGRLTNDYVLENKSAARKFGEVMDSFAMAEPAMQEATERMKELAHLLIDQELQRREEEDYKSFIDNFVLEEDED